jgi:hypothetical protein
MSEKSGSAPAVTGAIDTETLSANLGEVRRVLAGEVKLRSTVIKPLEGALRALKDPHRNAVALAETVAVLENAPPDLTLPTGYQKIVRQLRAVADEKLSELEFAFARDLREAFKEKGLKLTGSPGELIADLFVIGFAPKVGVEHEILSIPQNATAPTCVQDDF